MSSVQQPAATGRPSSLYGRGEGGAERRGAHDSGRDGHVAQLGVEGSSLHTVARRATAAASGTRFVQEAIERVVVVVVAAVIVLVVPASRRYEGEDRGGGSA